MGCQKQQHSNESNETFTLIVDLHQLLTDRSAQHPLWISRLFQRLNQIDERLEYIMGAQDDLDAQVTELNSSLDSINSGVSDLKTQNQTIADELAAVEAQLAGASGTADVDLGPLKDAVAKAKGTADALQPATPVTSPTVPDDGSTPVDSTLPEGTPTPSGPSPVDTTTEPPAPAPPADVPTPDLPPVDETPVDALPADGEVVTPVPVDPQAAPVQAGDLDPATPVVEVPANVTPVEVPADATVITAGELPAETVVTPVQ